MAFYFTALLSIVAISLVSARHLGKPPAVFAVLGDWGRCADGDWSLSAFVPQNCVIQTDVGRALGYVCKAEGCNFLINVGDNFYDLGIDATLGASDPQWASSFNNIYNNESLTNIKFYGALGNHDYGKNGSCNATATHSCFHSILPQIDYTYADPTSRWYLPGRYYKADLFVGDQLIRITTTDTSPQNNGYCGVPTNKYNTPELLQFCAPQVVASDVSNFNRSTAYAKKRGMWNIVVGHHPVVGGSAPYTPLSNNIIPILQANTPHMWFNGHDHVATHYQTDSIPKTEFFTSGHGGTYASGDQSGLVNTSTSRYPFFGKLPGFAIVKLYPTYATIQFWEVTSGTVANAPQFSYTKSYFYSFNKTRA